MNVSAQLISRRELRALVPVSDMTLWRWLDAGRFPQPIKMSGRNYWRSDELQAWLDERSDARRVA